MSPFPTMYSFCYEICTTKFQHVTFLNPFLYTTNLQQNTLKTFSQTHKQKSQKYVYTY